jgi:hypothetical protein
MLEKEKETYEKNKKQLLTSSAGKFVLIKEDKIIDIFESEKDAIKKGIELYGNQEFLVKKIEAFDEVQNFTSNLILV